MILNVGVCLRVHQNVITLLVCRVNLRRNGCQPLHRRRSDFRTSGSSAPRRSFIIRFHLESDDLTLSYIFTSSLFMGKNAFLCFWFYFYFLLFMNSLSVQLKRVIISSVFFLLAGFSQEGWPEISLPHPGVHHPGYTVHSVHGLSCELLFCLELWLKPMNQCFCSWPTSPWRLCGFAAACLKGVQQLR